MITSLRHAVGWVTLLVFVCVGRAYAQPAPEGPRLTRAPELVRFVAAEYPESERQAGRAASVVLRLRIDADGRVTEAQVAQSAGAAFDSAAVAAARQFEFRPAEVDGVPSPIRIEYRYEFKLEQELPTTAALVGTVRDRARKAPVAGVTVTASTAGTPPFQASAVTDTAGRFTFADVPAGAVSIRLEGAGLTPLSTSETVKAGEKLEVTYDVSLPAPTEAGDSDSDDMEIVVTAPPLRREVVSTAVRADEARKVPGTSGDVLRVVENLPGVARSSVGSGQLVVWGASPGDTRIYIDGVPIPRLYHQGGLRSVVQPELVRSVELVPGGYAAAFGRGLGGLVTVTGMTPTETGFHGSVGVDVLDASAVVRGGTKDGYFGAAAARTSLLDLWADTTLDDDVTSFVPIPSYRDGQIRSQWRLGAGEHVEVVGLLSTERFSRGVPNADPALRIWETRDLDFYRVYARYLRERKGSVTTVTPFVGFTRSRREDGFGSTVTSVRSNGYLAGLRASHRARLATGFDIETGMDAEVNTTSLEREGSIALPAREGDIRVFGQPPPDQIGADDWTVVHVGIAPYVQADLSFFDDKLHVLPGVRVDPYARSASRRIPSDGDSPAVGLFEQNFAVEPRIAVRGDIGDVLTLHGAVGMYRQQPMPEDMSASFANPTLPTSRATHFLAGANVHFTKTLSLEVTGFLSLSDDLAARSPLSSPLRAEALEPIGEGRAYGVQSLLRQELFENFFGWVTYTWMRSERRDEPGGPWRLFDYDQTHVLTAVASYELPLDFEIGARFRFSTGFPRTPVVGAYYDARRNAYQPEFGDHNATRIPSFVQLDLRASKQFAIADTELDVYLEVLNVWNQKNPEEIVYSPDFSRRGYITGLPLLPVLGAQWRF